MVPPCFAQTSRKGPYGVRAYSCALTGAPGIACAFAVGMRLRNHVRRGLRYPFSPFRALCDLSTRVLFPSLPLLGVIQFSTSGLGIEYYAASELSRGKLKKADRRKRRSAFCPYIVPGPRRSRHIFAWRSAVRRRLLRRVTRLSLRRARWVPTDCAIWTRMTISTVATSMTAMLYL